MKKIQHRRRSLSLAGCAGASALLLIATGCGSTSGAKATNASSSPITIGMACSTVGPYANDDCPNAGTEIMNEVKATGGIHGRQIKVIQCAENISDASTISGCLNQLVNEDHVTALGEAAIDTGFGAAATANHMVYMAGFSDNIPEASNPNTFWTDAAGDEDYLIDAKYAVSIGKLKGVFLYPEGSGQVGALVSQIIATFKSKGGSATGVEYNPSESIGPYLAKAQAAGDDVVIDSTGGLQSFTDLLTSAEGLDYRPLLMSGRGGFDKQLTEKLPKNSPPLVFTEAQAYWGSPQAATLVSNSNKYAPTNWDYTYLYVNAYLGLHALVEAMRSMPASEAITRSSLLKTMDTFKFSNPVMQKTVNYGAIDPPCPEFGTRVPVDGEHIYELKDGVVQVLNDDRLVYAC